jgi:5-formyltetrahydrofolate cyclo-ligase
VVTWTSEINLSGIRIWKGDGFFDYEWGMFFSLKMVKSVPPCMVAVHDCQVLDAELQPEVFDTRL